MLQMRMQRAAVIAAMQRMGVDRIEVTRQEVHDGAALDLVMSVGESGLVVNLKPATS